MSDTGGHDCLRELEARCDAVPAALRALVDSSSPCLDPEIGPELAGAARWVVTGIGASEWPARVLASRLRVRARCAARFVPLSAFADAETAPDGDALVVVSQGLSPNARLALRARERFTHGLLVTGRAPSGADARGFRVCAHGPDDEPGLLLRVVGPPLATFAAFRLAERVALARGFDADPTLSREALREAPDAFARALLAAKELDDGPGELLAKAALTGSIAFVTAGDGTGELAHGLRWKLLEGLGVGAPVWDVLGFAHGPFQRFVGEALTLVALDLRGGTYAPLFARLQRLLDPALHRLVVLTPRALDGLGGFFEHDALLDGVVLRALARAPRDLRDWPGKGLDGPLYDVGADAAER